MQIIISLMVAIGIGPKERNKYQSTKDVPEFQIVLMKRDLQYQYIARPEINKPQ